MSLNFNNPKIEKHMFEAVFGLEKECLRIDRHGFLAQTKHPFESCKNIEKDFCESQTEFITDAFDTTISACEQLKKLHISAHKKLQELGTGREYLWPFSNPPYVTDEDDIPVASYSKNLKGKEIYRQYLSEKYGKMKMLYSGIHFNFNFSDALIKEGFCESDSKEYYDYKNKLYLELAKKLMKHNWLIVFLTAASPVADSSFFKTDKRGKGVVTDYSSLRCSEAGYWNYFVPVFKYDSLDKYIDSIQKYIDNGLLKSASELYYPVRLKPAKENSLENLRLHGVNHIELRMIDLNPLSPTAIFLEDMDFLHLLIIYLMSLEDAPFDKKEQIVAVKNSKNAAKYDDLNTYIKYNNKYMPLRYAAESVLIDIEKFYKKHSNGKTCSIIKYQQNKISLPHNRYCDIIKEKFATSYVEKGINLAKSYTEILLKEGYECANCSELTRKTIAT